MNHTDPTPQEAVADDQFAIDAARMLRNAGLKVTRTRVGLLNLLARKSRHLTADEITAGLHAEGIRLDRVTVYRNIERLLDVGIFVASFLPGRALRVGLCRCPDAPHHHHIVCLHCGKLAETQGCLVSDRWETLRQELEAQTGFALEGHVMQYVGVCPECRAAGKRGTGAEFR